MKICFIADPNHANTLNWARYFAEVLCHQVHIICLKEVRNYDEHIIYHESSIKFVFSKLKYITSIFFVRSRIRRIKPDILIGYRVTSYGFLAALSGFRPLVIAAQGQNIVYPKYSLIKNLTARYALKKAKLIHAWGPHMASKIVKFGGKPENILIKPRGVFLDKFMRINPSKRSSKLHLVSTRSLNPEPHYNIKPILDALFLLKKDYPKVFYTIAGDGPMKQKMIRYAEELGLKNQVNFVGALSYDKIAAILNTANIYISNVWSDGVSSSLLEAMACGCFPVVVNNISNRLWIKNNINGILFPADDSHSITKSVSLAWENKELREKAMFFNLELVKQKASWEKNMSEFESAYFKLINYNLLKRTQ
jgi:glycosyltransferase involved in cell wall biosynthesis